MSTVLTSLKNSTLTITLNRSEKYNCFTESMAIKLQNALKSASEDEEIRCVILKANGSVFSAGQDLPEVVERGKEKSYSLAHTVDVSYNPIIRAIRNLPKPAICAVQGTAAGAAANIAFACDIVIASERAVFVQAFRNIGLLPDSGGTYFLPRLAGIARTNALYLLNEKLTAEKAVEFGLIYKAVGDEHLEKEVQEIAQTLAKMPTKGIKLYKQAINHTFENSLEEQLSLEADLQAEAGKSQDYQEGVAAFLEKRNPDFKGV